MKKGQGNSCIFFPEKLWEYEYFYIDLSFPMGSYDSRGDIFL